MNWLLIVFSGLFGAVASMLLRLVTVSSLNPWLLRGGAIFSYGIGFVLYAMALKNATLSIAYPVMVSVSILAVLLFTALYEDALKWPQLLGALLIILGIWLISKNA